MTTTADTDANIDASISVWPDRKYGLIDLGSESERLNEFDGGTVDMNYTTALGGAGHSNGSLEMPPQPCIY
jgi:hypothetical protein